MPVLQEMLPAMTWLQESCNHFMILRPMIGRLLHLGLSYYASSRNPFCPSIPTKALSSFIKLSRYRAITLSFMLAAPRERSSELSDEQIVRDTLR